MQVSDNELTDDGQPGAAASGLGRKMYYSIGEVCAMTGVVPHILRYWEKEFSLLRPKKNSGGKRAYKEKDIEAIIKIKHLLEKEKYTLHGAKDKLLDERRVRRTGSGKGLASTDSSALEPEATSDTSSSTSTPTAPAATLTRRRKPVPKKKAAGRGADNDGGSDCGNGYEGDNGNRGNGRALILSVRDELLGVLGLLER